MMGSRTASSFILAGANRAPPRQAAIAGLAGILPDRRGVACRRSALQPEGGRVDPFELIANSKRAGLEIGGAVINGLGLLGLAATLRLPVRRKPGAQAGDVSGRPDRPRSPAAVAAIGGIAYGVEIAIKSHQFVTHGTQTSQGERVAQLGRRVAVLQYAGLLGSLMLAVAFVLGDAQRDASRAPDHASWATSG